jgi:spore coat protein CotH
MTPASGRWSIRTRRSIAGVGMALSISLVGTACATGTNDAASAAPASAVAAVATQVAMFDATVVHDVSVTFDEADYEAMIETYSTTSEKEWIEATVTVDGATYNRVGIRLKGNSSLRGLSSGSTATGDADPSGLPWLIRFDKYIEGQDHQGYHDLVIRSNNTDTSLNEAVTLELLELAGLASQEAIATGFSVNGSEPVLRLAIEHPDDVWLDENFENGGALYKAESTGDYSYRGDDPDAYDEVFDQEVGKDDEDLTPLIDFLDFINNADDDVFNSELPERLDVESFATYLAMQDLIDNFDDIDGPGNNSYLSYDSETDVFTVVAWDHNLAFGVVNDDMMPGGPPPDGLEGALPGDTAVGPPNGGPPGGGPDGPPANGLAAGGPGDQSNVLKDRFLANTDFAALYDQALQDLTASLYESGVAADMLATWVEVIEASGLVDQTTIAVEAEAVGAYFAAGP